MIGAALSTPAAEHAQTVRGKHLTIAAGRNLDILQRRQGVDNSVVAVRDPEHANGEVVLSTHNCRFTDPLYVHAATCSTADIASGAVRGTCFTVGHLQYTGQKRSEILARISMSANIEVYRRFQSLMCHAKPRQDC